MLNNSGGIHGLSALQLAHKPQLVNAGTHGKKKEDQMSKSQGVILGLLSFQSKPSS